MSEVYGPGVPPAERYARLVAQVEQDEKTAAEAAAAIAEHGDLADFRAGPGTRQTFHDVDGMCEPERRFISRFDPARLLRELAARRRRVQRHQPVESTGSPVRCSQCGAHQFVAWPCWEIQDDLGVYEGADRG